MTPKKLNYRSSRLNYRLIDCLPTVAPKIDRKNLRDITVRENEGFHFDVKIIGEPPPDVTWVLNNKSIQQTTFRRIQNVPYNTKFFNDKPERKDSGIYKITAVNQYGSDTAEVEVTVVCTCSFISLFRIRVERYSDKYRLE